MAQLCDRTGERATGGMHGDSETRAQLLQLLQQASPSRKSFLQELRPFSAQDWREEVRQYELRYTERHQEKLIQRRRSVGDILKTPLYTYGGAHKTAPVPNLANVTQWLNRKEKPLFHFTSNMWPTNHSGTLTITKDREWRERNPERAQTEDFKVSLSNRYPSLIDHTACFFQKSHYGGQIDFSRLFLISRPYDDDVMFAQRRFPETLLAEFARDCQAHGLRTLISDDDYRIIRCRFILIADCNVDLEKAWGFAMRLPKA